MKPGFPTLSVVSLLFPFLVGVGSFPLWLRAFGDDPTGKAGYFIVLAALIGATLTTSVGAIAGAIIAYVAHRRRERFIFVRVFSFIVNVGLVGYGGYVWFSLSRGVIP